MNEKKENMLKNQHNLYLFGKIYCEMIMLQKVQATIPEDCFRKLMEGYWKQIDELKKEMQGKSIWELNRQKEWELLELFVQNLNGDSMKLIHKVLMKYFIENSSC